MVLKSEPTMNIGLSVSVACTSRTCTSRSFFFNASAYGCVQEVPLREQLNVIGLTSGTNKSTSVDKTMLQCQILANMGKQFGNLAKINGIVYFRLSPYEQKAFKGIISEGVPNTIRRFQSSIFRVAPFFMFSYLLMNWAKEKNQAFSRKNPKDYENDT